MLMDAADILNALLLVSIILGILLALISTASAGRTVADLERQSERGIVGGPRIQAWVNLRTHANRIALGMVFAVINVMLLAGAPEPWRMWTNRILWTLLLAGFAVSAALDWMAEREQVRLSLRALEAERDFREVLAVEAMTRRTSDATTDRVVYRQIADEAVTNLEHASNLARMEHGQPPLVFMAPVVAEHSSPATVHQQEIAAAATLRARLVAATLALGLPPRETAETVGDSVDAEHQEESGHHG